jgi:hypothetical protein
MIDGLSAGGSPKPKRKITTKQTDTEPAFRTPEEVAGSEIENINIDNTTPEKTKPGFASAGAGKKRRSPKEWFLGLDKRQKIAVIVAAVLLIGGAGAAFEILRKPEAKPAPVVKKEEPKEPAKRVIYSPLTGVAVSKEQSELPVTGIMIENSPDARPQSGLNKAGVVFEAIAEGGITRFLTLFQEEQPDYVGPVRSVRPYYVDWLQGFDAAVAHAGGSGEALAKIQAEGVKDLDQFANGGAFKRVSNRYAPHNLYTNLSDLTNLQRSKGWNGSKFTGFPRKAEAASSAPTARSVDIKISGALYDVHYDYDAASNSYKRVLAGRPHTDERSKEQISPKVMVALVVPYSIHGDGIHSVYQTIGTGHAYIFQDGIVTEATWEKTSGKSQITFKDAAGKAVAFNAGQTWITATGLATNVSYKP